MNAIASAVEEQNSVTAEIARNAQDVARGSQDITTAIAGVSETAGTSNQAAELVQVTIGELAQQSTMLREELDRFLTNIRSA